MESEVRSWLEKILKIENFSNVKIVGSSEKGDGFMGDIVFVEVTGGKTHHLVLKCAKKSAPLREKSPVKEAFLNEIFCYDSLFPEFSRFQNDRKIQEPFDKVAKCYGTLVSGEMEVLALENLKNLGYVLWDRKTPLTRKHIDLIVENYGKLHAISIAMRDQEPQRFENLASKLCNVLKLFDQLTNMIESFEIAIENLYQMLKSEDYAPKWRALKGKVRPFFTHLWDNVEGMQVICHGDCWTNNFMHYHRDGVPTNFAMIDWQLAFLSSPVIDLSYFLFTCIGEQDIEDMDTILRLYHNSLITHLEKLGSSRDLYPFGQFLDEWKRYSKMGVTFSMIIHRTALSEQENLPDLAKSAENGQDVLEEFILCPISDPEAYKKRMSYIIKHAIKNDLV